ncbi:type 2 isopentenyl-diphosphate Delta-isomerase [Halobacillus sp. A5]|uniref:type 2 isopentenyl-diphosphate Delta-isomerase n=1 Tax=Halobacillus sp. A5 TaxID=2880263 RepID=UPI0020A6A1AF|nr:type 2 isopentenyl-diphosphate Delta-isomerase [Halobacillus sp. A5]MCP3025843.1 type 2 isopentenyl-diphosphate Delta-isomerase [Halobacillus sp. A5]
MSRAKRKLDHIQHALSHTHDVYNHFDDINIVHQSLTSMNFDQLHLNANVGELNLSSPIFVNAMTGGGGDRTLTINRQLARAAAETGIGMAVGSQMSAIKDPAERPSYEIVRKENKHGPVFANVGTEASLEQAESAVDMIEAEALQIHLNTLQELIMPEGDRDFSSRIANIEAIVSGIDIPVIVKEVGYGMSKDAVKQLYELGVRYIDVGGRGGTNFSKVENMRREKPLASFDNWGIPTPISLAEVSQDKLPGLHILGSGGIRHGVDGAKTLVLGAEAFGMAGSLLKVLIEEGYDSLIDQIEHVKKEIKMVMMLTNSKNVSELRQSPYTLHGKTKEWVDQRCKLMD